MPWNCNGDAGAPHAPQNNIADEATCPTCGHAAPAPAAAPAAAQAVLPMAPHPAVPAVALPGAIQSVVPSLEVVPQTPAERLAKRWLVGALIALATVAAVFITYMVMKPPSLVSPTWQMSAGNGIVPPVPAAAPAAPAPAPAAAPAASGVDANCYTRLLCLGFAPEHIRGCH
ncbi:hypothetical protein HY839_04780 [Candidatus Azambacteria bacterium]|nr:hypothetical protein [Candidatus Azambacteria bacterium]